jgi:hypothetical protein
VAGHSNVSCLPSDPNNTPDGSSALRLDLVQHGAEWTGKSQPRVWTVSARAEPNPSMIEDDDNFRQEADEDDRYRMDARTAVFVNGKLVYADKNLFEVEDARKVPDARCSLENVAFTLPLERAIMRSQWQSRTTSSDGD